MTRGPFRAISPSPNGRFLSLLAVPPAGASASSTAQLWVTSSDFSRSLSEFSLSPDVSEGERGLPRLLEWCGSNSVVAAWERTVVMVGPFGETLKCVASRIKSTTKVRPLTRKQNVTTGSSTLIPSISSPKSTARESSVPKRPSSCRSCQVRFSAIFFTLSDRTLMSQRLGSLGAKDLPARVDGAARPLVRGGGEILRAKVTARRRIRALAWERARDGRGDRRMSRCGCPRMGRARAEEAPQGDEFPYERTRMPDCGSWAVFVQAAAFGKSFLDAYNPSDFVEATRTLRVLNAVRDYKIGLPLTWDQ